MKKYKLKFKPDMGEALIQVINRLLEKQHESDDDKLVMAGLAEIKVRLYKKLAVHQQEYTISLTPVQALSFRIMQTDFVTNHKTQIGNYLLLASNAIAKTYAI